MRFLYIPMIFTLWWSYCRALKCARDNRTPFTPLMGWLVGLGYFVVVPLTILVLNGGYQIPEFYEASASYASVDLSSSHYILPTLVIWLSLFLTFRLVAIVKPERKPAGRMMDLRLDHRKLRRTLVLTASLSLADWIFSVWRSGGLESFLISHWYLRQEAAFSKFGDLFVLYAQMAVANQVIFTAAAALFTASALRLRKYEWRWFGLIGLCFLLQMVMSGNRIFVALYGLSLLTACWNYQSRKLVGALLILSPLILLFFSAWAYFRHNVGAITEDLPGYAEARDDMENRLVTTLMDTTEGVNVLQLMHIINDFGTKFDFFYGSTYGKAATFVVPRALYPSKPENYPVQIARLYEPEGTTSLATTQLGELYANFGVLAVLLLPFLTLMLLLLTADLARNVKRRPFLLAILFLLSISLARASFEDNFITFLFTMGLSWILNLRWGSFLRPHSRPNLLPATE